MGLFDFANRSAGSKAPGDKLTGATDLQKRLAGSANAEVSGQPNEPVSGTRKASPTTPQADSAKRKIEKHVLFVGGDLDWFNQLKRDTLCHQPDWLCTRVAASSEAEATLASGAFGALILDGGIPHSVKWLTAREKE